MRIITNEDDVVILEHNGLAITMDDEELAALCGKSSGELIAHFRENRYPLAGKNERKAIVEILKSIDHMPIVIEEYLSATYGNDATTLIRGADRCSRARPATLGVTKVGEVSDSEWFSHDAVAPVDDVHLELLWSDKDGERKKRLWRQARRHEMGHGLVAWHFSLREIANPPFERLNVESNLDPCGNADGSFKVLLGALVPKTAPNMAAVCLAGLFAERSSQEWTLAKWRASIAWHQNRLNSRLDVDLNALKHIAGNTAVQDRSVSSARRA